MYMNRSRVDEDASSKLAPPTPLPNTPQNISVALCIYIYTLEWGLSGDKNVKAL